MKNQRAPPPPLAKHDSSPSETVRKITRQDSPPPLHPSLTMPAGANFGKSLLERAVLGGFGPPNMAGSSSAKASSGKKITDDSITYGKSPSSSGKKRDAVRLAALLKGNPGPDLEQVVTKGKFPMGEAFPPLTPAEKLKEVEEEAERLRLENATLRAQNSALTSKLQRESSPSRNRSASSSEGTKKANDETPKPSTPSDPPPVVEKRTQFVPPLPPSGVVAPPTGDRKVALLKAMKEEEEAKKKRDIDAILKKVMDSRERKKKAAEVAQKGNCNSENLNEKAAAPSVAPKESAANESKDVEKKEETHEPKPSFRRKGKRVQLQVVTDSDEGHNEKKPASVEDKKPRRAKSDDSLQEGVGLKHALPLAPLSAKNATTLNLNVHVSVNVPPSPTGSVCSPKSATMKGMFPKFFHVPALPKPASSPAAVLGSSRMRSGGGIFQNLAEHSPPLPLVAKAKGDNSDSPASAATTAGSPYFSVHCGHHIELMKAVDDIEKLSDYARDWPGEPDGLMLIKESDGQPLLVNSFGRKFDGEERLKSKYLILNKYHIPVGFRSLIRCLDGDEVVFMTRAGWFGPEFQMLYLPKSAVADDMTLFEWNGNIAEIWDQFLTVMSEAYSFSPDLRIFNRGPYEVFGITDSSVQIQINGPTPVGGRRERIA